MDKRTQIAVLLVALILGGNLAYTAYYQKKKLLTQPRRPATTAPAPGAAGPDVAPSAGAPPSAPASPSAPGNAATTPTTDGAAALGPFTAATEADGDLIVETPLQQLRIRRAGGVLGELQLHKFSMYSTKAPVNLVPPSFVSGSGYRALGLVLRAPGSVWDLGAARFDPEPGVFGSDGKLELAAGSPPRSFDLRCEATGGGAVIKRFTIDPERYDFGLDLRLERGGALQKIDSYTLDWTTGMPATEGNAKEDEMHFRVKAAVDQQLVIKKSTDFRRTEATSAPGTVRWTCMQSKYFMVGLIPSAPQPGTAALEGDSKTHWLGMRITQPTPWRTDIDSYRVYAGPSKYDQVRALGVGMESAVELGYRWIRPISGVLLHFMQFLNKFIPNYGIIIIIVSALAKLVFWPLTERSMRSMRRMQELQPRMEEIRRRYKDDPKAMNEQVMLMYKEQKVNPVGGCMPILIQTPMFFALFSVLQSNIELRNAPFVAWIDNLAGPDVLYRLPMTLPVIGQNLSLLPLLMGGAMLWQSAIGGAMTAPSSGASPNPMAQQQFLMKWIMPIMMTFFFYKMPSGLVLYWTVNTLMGIAQQVQINRKFGPAPAVIAAAPKSEGGATHGRPDRVDGAERGGSAAERPDRVRGQSR